MIWNAYSPRFLFSGFRSLATQIPRPLEDFISGENTFLNPKDNDGHLSIAGEDENRTAEKRTEIVRWARCQLAISPGSVERPPRLKLREGGAVQLHYNDIQSQFIQALSNGLWIANPPHRGVAALSLRPQSQHTLTTIDPTKSEGSGPQRCAARALNSGL